MACYMLGHPYNHGNNKTRKYKPQTTHASSSTTTLDILLGTLLHAQIHIPCAKSAHVLPLGD